MAEIVVRGAVPRFPEFRFRDDIDLHIGDGQCFAVIGPNGAGKSQLVDIMLGNTVINSGLVSVSVDGKQLPHTQMAFMTFRDIYRMSDATGTYYQQRWNATENEETPFVSEILHLDTNPKAREVVEEMQIESIVGKRLLFLSSGELRKLLIAKVLLRSPKVLVIKNPYIGLDASSRVAVNDLLRNLAEKRKIQIGLVVSNPADIPDFVDVVVPVKDKRCLHAVDLSVFQRDKALQLELFPEVETSDVDLPVAPLNDDGSDYANAIIMQNVSIAYQKKQILKDVCWSVQRGEKWALLGKNGCGKSTLLSLVCGDNPQGYANDITLFDRRRGSGESIWEIKNHIGYLSPDMHTYYNKNIPCVDIVASGFFDTVGLYRQPNDAQRQLAMNWMRTFGADHLAEKLFLQTSFGEQRLVLLARVFVKHPSLVILDEPLHGLDVGKKTLAKKIIEHYCSRPEVTLIYVTHYEHEIPSIVTQRKTLVKPQ